MGLPTPMNIPRDWAGNFELPMGDTELCISPILLYRAKIVGKKVFTEHPTHVQVGDGGLLSFSGSLLSISFRLWT